MSQNGLTETESYPTARARAGPMMNLRKNAWISLHPSARTTVAEPCTQPQPHKPTRVPYVVP